MNHRPRSGEIYKHFKDKLYQIVTIAKHSETGEELVIYQALYGDYKCYARPLEMFVSEVDHEKYPDVKQKYRFELRTSNEVVGVSDQVETEDGDCSLYLKTDIKPENASCKEKAACENRKEGLHESKTDRIKYLTAEERMMAFFDTDDLEERYKILSGLRDDITDTMIDNMAVVMDIVIEDGNLTKRYDDLKHAIQTKQRYEQNTRLR